MELRETLTLIDNQYHASVALVTLTDDERRALIEFGDLKIAVGGFFGNAQVQFTIDERDRTFPSQFPVKVLFDLRDSEQAAAKAGLWIQTVRDRILAERDALLSTPRGTIFDTITNYPFEGDT